MQPEAEPDAYAAAIPAQASGTRVDYYIHAADNAGRAEGMPRPEPAAWYSFVVTLPATDAAALPGGDAVLAANAPNPFHTATRFSFALKYEDHVRLVIYDAQGRRVRTLVDRTLPAGSHAVDWDARNEAGEAMAAGTYFYRLQLPSLTYTRKSVLAK
jgi:hypothetical protein